MKVFDEYSRRVICSYLTEQNVTLPKTGKEGQVFQIPGNKKQRYVFSGNSWRLWPQGEPKPKFETLTPQEQREKGREYMFGRKGVPGGYDLENQAMWWNYRNMIEKQLEGITAGTISSASTTALKLIPSVMQSLSRSGIPGLQNIGSYAPGVSQAIDKTQKARELAALPMEYAVKQALRTAAAKVYLGGTDDLKKAFEAELSVMPNIPGVVGNILGDVGELAYKAIDPGTFGLTGLYAAGRFGEAGKREAEDIGRIAVMGKDPFEYALTKFGAKDAAETINRQATAIQPGLESMGGALQNLKRLGIAK